MTRIALFASGNGSNAENIVRHFSGNDKISVALIVSNKQDAYVHERARQLGVPSYTFGKSEFDDGGRVLELLRSHNVDFIVLAGFLLKVSAPILKCYPQKIVNIHPALLPKFGGKGMYGDRVHEAVVAAGESESGITIHYINENYDEGDVIFQSKCEVLPGDTPADVAHKVHALEYAFYPFVIEKVLEKTFA